MHPRPLVGLDHAERCIRHYDASLVLLADCYVTPAFRRLVSSLRDYCCRVFLFLLFFISCLGSAVYANKDVYNYRCSIAVAAIIHLLAASHAQRVARSVCWTHGCTLQKRLNRS